jgi:tRNA-dihydrouridine synthase
MAVSPATQLGEEIMNTVHRIYTEDVDRKAVIRAASEEFDSFTLQPTTGYYNGKAEKSVVIEVVGANKSQIAALAKRIGKINGQKSVLIITLKGQSKKIQLARDEA